jgi:hypothetical protein
MNSYIKRIQFINEVRYYMVYTILIQSFVIQYYNPLINEVNVCLKRMTRTIQHIIIVPMINTKLQDSFNMIQINKFIDEMNSLIS